MYLALKLLHIAAVVLFLGNITTGLFWHAWAARTRDPTRLAHTMAGIMRSDRLFTVPGIVVIVATGIAAAIYGQLPILGTGWILWTIIQRHPNVGSDRPMHKSLDLQPDLHGSGYAPAEH